MKCLTLTNKAFLLGFGTQHAGIVLDQGDQFVYLSLKKRLAFDSLEHIAKKFGKLEFDTKLDSAKLSDINSFPVKHSDAVLVSINPPIYSRDGEILFVAGYWAINHKSGWILAFCPKQNTVKQTEAVGPFKSRLEAANKIASMKRGT